MKKLLILPILLLIFCQMQAQSYPNVADMEPDEDFENVWTKELHSDTLVSTFLIWIKKSVQLHQHADHTENILFLSGTGDMQLGNERLSVVSGDLIVIPKNTPHSLNVTSREPVKIISIQSPKFDGSDRVYPE